VTAKYGIEADSLRKSMETNAETLRKRQKCINFGKVTAEYQNYVMELPRKARQARNGAGSCTPSTRTPTSWSAWSKPLLDFFFFRFLLYYFRPFTAEVQFADFRSLTIIWIKNNRHSIDTNDSNEHDMTDDFGGASNVGSGISGYNIDDFDILDDSDDPDANKLIVDTPIDEI